MIYFFCRSSLPIFDYNTDEVFAVIEAPAGFAAERQGMDPASPRLRRGEHVRSLQAQRGKDCLLNTRGRRDLARGKPMTHRKKEKGQSLLEYAMVAAVVAAAVIAMSTYVFRSVQATQQMIQTEFQKE